MIGRTDAVHAEPITFGFKIANWYSETQRNIVRFKAASEDLRVGKFSGAVGTFAHLSPELEEKICARLGLKAAAVSSHVIQRDRHAYYLATLTDPAPPRPRRSRAISRGRIPSGAGTCSASMERGSRFPRTGAGRSGHRRPRAQSED